jgi:hypothetical protein
VEGVTDKPAEEDLFELDEGKGIGGLIDQPLDSG